MIPYGQQIVDQADIDEVVQVLNSDWLTTGPAVARFEKRISEYCGIAEAIAFSSGTAALHAAVSSLNLSQNSEVITTPLTFVATANAILYAGAKVVFSDVDEDTLNINPDEIEKKINSGTKAIIAVDYAGQPCQYDILREICDRHKLMLIADSCHAIGAEYHGQKIGSLADMTVFSFHPVKQITTGEGGMVVCHDKSLAEKLKVFRNHGISTDFRQREKMGSWEYDMVNLGYNYRISDMQCALGSSQLNHLDEWVEKRNQIAGQYDTAFAGIPGINPLICRSDVKHAYHLYVIQIIEEEFGLSRNEIFRICREKGIGANVHYKPVYLHSYYREKQGFSKGLCPIAEKAYNQVLSIPMFPGLKQDQQTYVIDTLTGLG